MLSILSILELKLYRDGVLRPELKHLKCLQDMANLSYFKLQPIHEFQSMDLQEALLPILLEMIKSLHDLLEADDLEMYLNQESYLTYYFINGKK